LQPGSLRTFMRAELQRRARFQVIEGGLKERRDG
jgi:hypothetical protein